MYKRKVYDTIIKRLEERRMFIQVIMGPRQIGKSTVIRQVLGTLQDAGDTVTLAGYLNLLGDSGLVTGLQKFSMDMARKRASIPKYQVYNNALLSVQMGLSYREALADNKQWGQIF